MQRQKEEAERYEKEKKKFKKNISFEDWKKLKVLEKEHDGQRSRSNSIHEDALTDEEKKKKSEEAYRKWFLKKELEEIQKDKNMLIDIQNQRKNNKKGRRGSWIDNKTSLKVAVKR